MIDDDLFSLCQHLNISENEINKPFSLWRFSVLHVRGVENLNSEDVYNYFSKTPHSIEWLSNISCNITFEDWQKAANALLTIANGLIVHKTDLQNSSSNMENLGLEVQTSDLLEIPVPPNYRYILGTDHPKAKSIIVRFATVNDRKVGGGGTDLIDNKTERSSSMATKPNYILDDHKDDGDNDMEHSGTNIIPRRTIFTGHSNQNRKNPNDVARVRMRMHADDEELGGRRQSYPDRDDDYEDSSRRRNNVQQQRGSENRTRRLNGRLGGNNDGQSSGFDRSRTSIKNDRIFTNSSRRIRHTSNGIETVGARDRRINRTNTTNNNNFGRPSSSSPLTSPQSNNQPTFVGKSKNNNAIWRRISLNQNYNNGGGDDRRIGDLRQKLLDKTKTNQYSKTYNKTTSRTRNSGPTTVAPIVSSTIRVQVSYDDDNEDDDMAM